MPRAKKNDYSQLTIAQLKTEFETTTQKLKDLIALLNSLSGVKQDALNTLGQINHSLPGTPYPLTNPTDGSVIRMPGASLPAPPSFQSLQPIPQSAIDDMFDSELAIKPLDPTVDLTEAEFKGFQPVKPEAV